ncbi:hypothetical protein [Pseudomonas phoenicis]|uniref:hypothetical protein n=2 Tax=Pseudomonas TaxID=286 RepID=UPI0039A3CA1E
MTASLSTLDVGLRTVDLTNMVEASRQHTQIWEESDFRALPLVQENLERYKKLLSRCIDRTVSTARNLETHLSSHMLNDVIHAWTMEDSAELLEVAEQEREKITSLLQAQITYLEEESKALVSLPELNGTHERARLRATLLNNAEHTQIGTETVERLEEDLRKALCALDTLEISDLPHYFVGRLPSIEALLEASVLDTIKLRTPVGIVGQALNDLEAALGQTPTGMSYAELVEQIDLLIKRVGEERALLRQAAQKQTTLTGTLAALDSLEPLTLQRCKWKGTVARLVHALRLHMNLLHDLKGQTLADVLRLDSLANKLLNFERHMLGQLLR